MSTRTALARVAVVAATALASLGIATTSATTSATAGGGEPQYVYSPGILDTDPTKSWFVSCPIGLVALGGGAFLIGDTAGVHLDLLRPAAAGAVFEAAASVTGRRPRGEWGLVVYGICAPRPAGLVYLDPVPSDSYDSPLRTALATCPAGKRVIGFGGRAAVEPGRNVALTVLMPSVDLTRVVVQSWAGEGGEPSDWTAEAYAVCADPVPGAEVVRTTAGPDASDAKVATSTCPAGKHLHAIGAGVFNAAGQAWYAGIYPSADLATGTALPVEDPTGWAYPWFVTSAGICA
jgi:hypothetical protein